MLQSKNNHGCYYTPNIPLLLFSCCTILLDLGRFNARRTTLLTIASLNSEYPSKHCTLPALKTGSSTMGSPSSLCGTEGQYESAMMSSDNSSSCSGSLSSSLLLFRLVDVYLFMFTLLLALLQQFTGFFKSIMHLRFIDTLGTFSHARGKAGCRSLNLVYLYSRFTVSDYSHLNSSKVTNFTALLFYFTFTL
jgi:hypothetical protein